MEKMESLCGQLDRAIEECHKREEELKKAQIEENQDSKDEKPQLELYLEKAEEALQFCLKNGIEKASNVYNKK